MDLTEPSVMGIHGILARVATEMVTMKDGRQQKLTTVTIAQGPPRVEVAFNFWHPNHYQLAELAKWEDMVHSGVDVTMLR